MPVNAAAPAASPAVVPASPAAVPASPDARRAGEETTQDSTFASLLAAIIAPPVPAPPMMPDGALAVAESGATPAAVMDPEGAAAPTTLLLPPREATAEAPAPGFGAALLAAEAAAAPVAQAGENHAAERSAAQPWVMPLPAEPEVESASIPADPVPLPADPAAVALTAQQATESATAPVAAAPVLAEPRRPMADTSLAAWTEEQPEAPPGAPDAAPATGATAPAVDEAGTERQLDTRSRARSIQQPEVNLQPAAPHASSLQIDSREAAEPERIPTPIEPARLMEAIAESLSTARPGRYTVSLQLHPESLGEVRLQVQVVGREVHTIMEVTTPAAKQALQERGDQLRQTLGQAGLTLSGFTVSTGAGRQSQEQRREQWDGMIAAQRRTGRAAITVGRVGMQPRMSSTERIGGRLDTLA